MARVCLLLATLFLTALVASVQSRVATIEDENIVDVTEVKTKDVEESELDRKILELKKKVKELVEQGKENEKAFMAMTDKVISMDNRVKEMTERLRKINQADYLNTGAEEINKL